MDLDTHNNAFYNAFPEGVDKIPFGDVLTKLIPIYITQPSSQILEIGCGAGALASWLTNLGHRVTSLEPAEKPAAIAREKGLEVLCVRLQDFQPPQQYEAVVAISSLIHIPRLELPAQLDKVAKALLPGGVLVITVLAGEGEGFADPTAKGKPRFFSKFSLHELRALLTPNFSILECQQLESRRMGESFFLLVLRRNIP